MVRLPAEDMTQRELLLRLRYAIDTAIQYPKQPNIDSAIQLAVSHPRGLRSGHLKHNLGSRRWSWLNAHSIYPIDEQAEIAGSIGIKAVITTPDITT